MSYLWAGGRRGVAGIDLDIAAGEVVAVLGPNGAGKSTLLRLLTGDLTPSAGEARVFGRPAHRLRGDERARLGIGVDEPAHADALSGRANALFFAQANGCSPDDAAARVAALLERLGLADDADASCGAYSFGMRRKLQLAEALVHEPELILLDEPTIGLDVETTATLRALLTERARAGAAILLATNDLHGATAAADRIVFLHEGRKVADATHQALLAPHHGRTRIDVTLAASPTRDLVFPAGAAGHLHPGGCSIESAAGTAILPALCAALVEAGAEIRAIRVKEPDLADVFRDLTGADLGQDDA